MQATAMMGGQVADQGLVPVAVESIETVERAPTSEIVAQWLLRQRCAA